MKLLILSLLLVLPHYEETAPDVTEVPEQSSSETQEINVTVDGGGKEAAQMIIDYLEAEKQAEKEAEEEAKRIAEAEAEKAAAEEAAALEEAAEMEAQRNEILTTQASLDATYSSNTNVIYGYCNRYRYYLSYDIQYQDGYYTRTNKYVYCFPEFTKFEMKNGKLYANTDGIKVSALYSGSVTTEDVTDGITVGGLYNAYTNIDIVDYPSLYQIDKEPYKAVETLINYCTLWIALWIGWMVTKTIIDG